MIIKPFLTVQIVVFIVAASWLAIVSFSSLSEKLRSGRHGN